MSPNKTDCLLALAELTRPLGEMCVPFAPICRHTGLTRVSVRKAVRALKRDGLAEFHVGLCNLDGEFAGAGYCITSAGQDVAVGVEMSQSSPIYAS